MPDFDKETVEEAYKELGSSPGGLSGEQASKRLQEYGPNAITEKKRNPVLAFLKRFASPFSIVIEVAIILSIVLKNWPDVGLIAFLLLLNVSVDFFQEQKTEGVIEGLRKRMAVKARVLRDGDWQTIDAPDLVPGDLVTVRGGDIVPADLKLDEEGSLELNEAALTGESLPVEKKRGDIAFSSSTVVRGESRALVVRTGDRTFFGRTASLAEEKQAESHFERAVNNVGKYIVTVAVLAIVAIIVVSWPVRHQTASNVILLALTLAVASVPAALPAVLAVTMTTGARHLAADNVLVRRLAAIEELASADIVCVDKTGTLTTGRLELGDPVMFSDIDAKQALEMALLCSNYPSTDDPIDTSLGRGAKKLGLEPQAADGWKRDKYVPADSNSKRALAEVEKDGKRRLIIKGAPQVVLAASKTDKPVAEKFLNTVDELAQKGYRAIGVAYRDDPADTKEKKEKDMVLAAVLPLHDPPREDTADTLHEASDLAIEVKMITGDHAAAAREIAGEVGLGGNVVTADEMRSWGDQEFADRAEETNIFAQVLPENKYRIVKALQEEGHIVGMTGDGVNDSPALRRADVGIAVEGATDVAKSVSDVILTNPGLRVIINGVREGKLVFSRMKNYVIYRISETIRLVVFIAGVILAFNAVPLGAHQIVLLAIVNDLPILTMAGDHVTEAKGPESWGMGRLIPIATVLGLTGLANSYGLYFIFRHLELAGRVTHGQLETAMFLLLSVSGHMLFFCARSRRNWFKPPGPSRLLLTAILTTMAFSTTISLVGLGPVLRALQPLYGLYVWLWALVWWQITDGVKLLTYRVVDSVVRPPGPREKQAEQKNPRPAAPAGRPQPGLTS